MSPGAQFSMDCHTNDTSKVGPGTHTRVVLMVPPPEVSSLVSVVESYDFSLTVLAGIAALYVTLEVLMARANSRIQWRRRSIVEPPNSLS